MNTLLDIVLWGIDQELAETVSELIVKRIKDLQKVLDRFDPASETFRVNQSAYLEELKVSPALFEIIKGGVKDFHRTQGYFNIFAGSAYASLRETGKSAPSILNVNFPEEMLTVDTSKKSVRFLHQDVSLDFGGIGKGLALDEVSSILDEMEIKNAFMSFGGRSILTRGHHPHGVFWPFSFQDQDIDQEVWPLNDDAVSVSSAEQGAEKNAHILNPKSGRSSENYTTGVQSESATEAEVLSTALVAAP
ncbi:FAD:protein FMN transferase, partial [Marinilabilia sp.]